MKRTAAVAAIRTKTKRDISVYKQRNRPESTRGTRGADLRGTMARDVHRAMILKISGRLETALETKLLLNTRMLKLNT